MLKFTGCILIVVASSVMGYMRGLDIQRHLEDVQTIRQLFLMLKSEIKYAKTPFAEAFYHIGRRMEGQYAKWLMQLSRELEEKTGAVFINVWSSTIENCLKDTYLSREDLNRLKEAGVHMGYMDEEMQLGAIRLFLEQLEIEIQQIRENIAVQRRLCNCLGVMGGIFLAVILM